MILKTREALRDFVKSRGAEALLKIKMILPTLTDEVCQSWASAERHPKGINLLALRFFLEAADYEIEELKVIRPEMYKVGQAIVFAGVSPQALADASGIERLKERGDLVLGYVTINNEIGHERATLFASLLSSSDHAVIATKVAALREAVGKKIALTIPDVVAKLVAAYIAVKPFVEATAHQGDRQALRQALQGAAVSMHEFNTMTTQLLSEQAYRNIEKLKGKQ